MIRRDFLFLARRAMIVLMSLLANDPPSAKAFDKLDIEPAKARFARLVTGELAQGILPGVSVSWVVDGQIVHSAGYGQADWIKGSPAQADTIYRAGSISKLLNAVAAMQLVEQGQLDLDAPIQKALPGFSIVVPFDDAPPITARQLLCHRSGMIREAPVGGYFDAHEPTVTQTVDSVAGCVLVNRPNSKTRYSNVGPTIVGRALEVQSGLSYADYQQKHILGPLGMHSSAWRMNDALRPRLAAGRMRIAQGDGSYADAQAPQFELGTIPSGNLYTTADDLSRLAIWVMSLANASDQPDKIGILRRESLAEMCKPQLIDEPTGFGLAFMVGRYHDHRSISHMGAVYGFTSSWCVLPEQRIGVIVLANADIAIAPVKRLSDASLDLLLEAIQERKSWGHRGHPDRASPKHLTPQFQMPNLWKSSPATTNRPATGHTWPCAARLLAASSPASRLHSLKPGRSSFRPMAASCCVSRSSSSVAKMAGSAVSVRQDNRFGASIQATCRPHPRLGNNWWVVTGRRTFRW